MLIDKDEETNEIFLEAAICSEKHEPDPPILAYGMPNEQMISIENATCITIF